MLIFFFSSRRRHTRCSRDWSSDVCSSDLIERLLGDGPEDPAGRAALLLNAGAAIYVAGLVASYADGVARAREAVRAGRARDALERLRRATNAVPTKHG